MLKDSDKNCTCFRINSIKFSSVYCMKAEIIFSPVHFRHTLYLAQVLCYFNNLNIKTFSVVRAFWLWLLVYQQFIFFEPFCFSSHFCLFLFFTYMCWYQIRSAFTFLAMILTFSTNGFVLLTASFCQFIYFLCFYNLPSVHFSCFLCF